MAWIDDYKASALHAEILASFSGTTKPVAVVVTFKSLELAGGVAAVTEADITAAVLLITTDLGWKAKVLFSEQKVAFEK